MAGPYTCCSSHQNPLPAGKNELAGVVLTESSGTSISTLIVSHAPTPAPTTAPAITPFLDNKLFKQFMKAYLEAQVTGQIKVGLEPCKQPLKAQFPDLYYDNLHMDCYWFCQ